MFCPICKSEYIEGVARCTTCNVALIPKLLEQPATHELKLVTVLEVANPAQLDCARGILDEAGIRHITKSEGLQRIYGLFVGPVELQVAEKDAQRAAELLDGIVQEANEEGETDG